MNSNDYRLRDAQQKTVRFPSDERLEEVRFICTLDEREWQSPQDDGPFLENRSRAIRRALRLEGVPPLFRCRSAAEIRHVIQSGQGAVADIYRGFNLLQWYCNAKSTSPSIIEELVRLGIAIDAVDQRTHIRGAIVRHTALGYACRNANTKAVATLLLHGANPCGVGRLPTSPRQDANGNAIMYPSPLQELMFQRIHGPRPGRCPWTYHADEEENDDFVRVNEAETNEMPEFREFRRLLSPLCQICETEAHVHRQGRLPEAERVTMRERKHELQYSSQVIRVGHRMLTCLQLLLNSYHNLQSDIGYAAFDDPRLWSGTDYLVETVWHFLGPVMNWWIDLSFPGGDGPSPIEHLFGLPQLSLAPFDAICDMLIEVGGYPGGMAEGESGQARLMAMIHGHPELESFRQGECFGFGTDNM